MNTLMIIVWTFLPLDLCFHNFTSPLFAIRENLDIRILVVPDERFLENPQKQHSLDFGKKKNLL
jgi:hypothetical protein